MDTESIVATQSLPLTDTHKELEVFLDDMVDTGKIQERTRVSILENFKDAIAPKKSFFSRKKAVVIETEKDMLDVLGDIYTPAIDDTFEDGTQLGQAFALYRREQKQKIDTIKARGILENLLVKVEKYEATTMDDGMDWGFDEDHRDEKFQKKIKQLFFDLVKRILVLLTLKKMTDSSFALAGDEAEQSMSLDDIYQSFITQDWLSTLTEGVDKKEEAKYEALKKLFHERDEQKLSGYKKDIETLKEQLETRKKIIEKRIAESEQWLATMPTVDVFVQTYAGLDVDTATYTKTYETYQTNLEEDKELLQLLIFKLADMEHILGHVSEYSSILKPGFRDIFTALRTIGAEVKAVQDKDPDLQSFDSIMTLKQHELQLETFLNKDLASSGKSIEEFLATDRQESYYSDYVMKLFDLVQKEHASLEQHVRGALITIQEELEKGIGPLLREGEELKSSLEKVYHLSSIDELRSYMGALPDYIDRSTKLKEIFTSMEATNYASSAAHVEAGCITLQEARDPLFEVIDGLDEVYESMTVQLSDNNTVTVSGPEVSITKQAEKQLLEHIMFTNHVRVFGTELPQHDEVEVYYYDGQIYLLSNLYVHTLSYKDYLSADLPTIDLHDHEGRKQGFGALTTETSVGDIQHILKKIFVGKQRLYPFKIKDNYKVIRSEYLARTSRGKIDTERLSALYLLNATYEDVLDHLPADIVDISDVQRFILGKVDIYTLSKAMSDRKTKGILVAKILKKIGVPEEQCAELLVQVGYKGDDIWFIIHEAYGGNASNLISKYDEKYKHMNANNELHI